MRGYENVLIFDPDLEEEVLEAEIEKLIELIKTGGGAVVEVNRWGKTRLAYEIGKKMNGFYVLIDFFSEPDLIPELDENLKLNQSLLRHSIGRTWVEPPPELVEKATKKSKKRIPAKKSPAKKKASPKKRSTKSKKESKTPSPASAGPLE